MAITSLGSFSGANTTDRTKRIPAAIAALNKSLTGDTAALLYMQQQAGLVPGFGSATAVGRDAFRRSLAIYAQQKPAVSTPPVAGQPVLLPTPVVAPPPPLIYTRPPVSRTDGSGVYTSPSEPKPIGFNPSAPAMVPPPVAGLGGVTVTGIAPGIITPVNVGSDGGVKTGPPAPEWSFSTAGAPPSPVGSDYAALGDVPTAPKASASLAPTAMDAKVILFLLAAAAALFFFVDSKRK